MTLWTVLKGRLLEYPLYSALLRTLYFYEFSYMVHCFCHPPPFLVSSAMSTAPEEVPKKAPEAKKAPETNSTGPIKKAQVSTQVQSRVPVPVDDLKAEFGDLAIINSSYKTDRVWTDIKDLSAAKEGESVWIRARCHAVRAKGKSTFMVIRRGLYTAQVVMCAFGNPGEPSIDLVKFAGKIPLESIVDIHGKVVKTANPIESVSQKDCEIQIQQLFVISAAQLLPFQIADANRYDPNDKGQDDSTQAASGEEKENTSGFISIGQSKRLDNRFIDLRTFANHAIFRIQSRVSQYFRQYFIDRDFVELHSPKIIAGVSEGGAQVFKLGYFGQTCCLAQSPQLYKQMGVTSDFFRVFEIGPVFRAEDSQTPRHMCEFTGLDFEMEVREHYHEVLKTLSDLFVYIFDQINANCKEELAAVNNQYPFTPLKYNRDVLVIDFKTARQMIVDAGEEMGEFADPSTPQERLLGRLIKEKYDVDLYIVDKYPSAVRPFYTMPCPDDAKYSNSYDVFLRGEEITSGAQRIHDHVLLAKRAGECGIPAESLDSYIQSFKYGATPHGGAGIGLERVVMLFLGLNTIRKSSLFPRLPNRVTP